MNLSSGYGEYDQRQISLAYLPPTPRQTRLALVGGAILLIGLAALAPFAGKPLPQANGFIPALDAIIFVTDLITASLFLAHFSINRSRALLVLACGYLFSALIVAAHGLTFPGAFPQAGDLARAARMNFIIYLVWHLGLPAALFAYVWLKGKERTTLGPRTPAALVAISSVAGTFALVGGVVWLVAAGDKLLPSPRSTFQPFPTPVTPSLLDLAILICAAALFVLWAFRRSVLDQWLMVVVLASMIELAITGRLGWHNFEHSHGFESRFTLGFYAGRSLFSLLTSTVVLTALLAETTKLYAGVANANMLASAVKASQALSSEIELPKLIERLMTIAIENAGADRGLLILRAGDEYLGQAEARATGDQVKVELRQDPMSGIACPESLIRHVIRTRERVILGDASEPNLFSGDHYLRDRQSKSILCLPLLKQNELTGILFLENALTSHAFMPARTAVLELLAGQAAISLENAALYTDLQLQVGLLQQLPVSAWTLKPDGTPDFVNEVWLEYSGQTLNFVRSHPEAWMTAVHPEDREIASTAFWDGVRSGRGFAMETRHLRAQDGTYRWHLNQAVVLRDSEGKVLKFVGTTTDIDDQKRAQDALRESEAGLVRVIDTIPALTWSMFPDGSNEFLSKKWYEYTGLSVEESVGSGWQGAFYPDDLPALMKKWTEMLASGEPGEVEARLRRHDGVYRWFLIRAEPFRDETGTIIRWYGTSTDIDERRRAEDELKRSEAFLQEGQRLSRTGTFCWRVKTGEIIWSEELFHIFGFDPERRVTLELIGSRVHPEDMPLMGDMISIAHRAESSFEYEHRIVMPDGSIKHIHLFGHAVHDAEGRLEYFGAAQDLTQHRLAEEALRQAQRDLARINRVTTMGELAASLAHEISQPISGAMTNANIGLRKLGRDEPNLDEVRGAFAKIVRDAQRAAEIISRIRSQFERGALNRGAIDVNEIIPETIALLRDETMRFNISIRTELAPHLPQIVGDRVQLQQVAMNLIVNSIEAMKEVDGMREIVIQSQHAENAQILVSISDTGVGIPPQLAEQIFDPFFTTKAHGTGMGLRICRSIIESHGGRLWAVGSQGRGATFHLNLPAAISGHR